MDKLDTEMLAEIGAANAGAADEELQYGDRPISNLRLAYLGLRSFLPCSRFKAAEIRGRLSYYMTRYWEKTS
jgi:hypothetical protein